MRRLTVLFAAVVPIAVATVGCAPEPPPSLVRISHPATLVGTRWEVVGIGDRAVVQRESIQLVVETLDRVSGVTGCNSLSGSVRYDEHTGAIAFGDVVTTKRACADPAAAALESGYLAGLRGAQGASIDEAGRLVLAGAGPTIVLVVGPQQAAPPVDLRPAGS